MPLHCSAAWVIVTLVCVASQPPPPPATKPKAPAKEEPLKLAQPKGDGRDKNAVDLPIFPPKPDGPPQQVEASLEIPDLRVRLAPSTDLEMVPNWILGTSEFGIMRQDLDIQWREEKRTITTLKPKVIERRVQVMTTRVLQKGEIDPETGEECCEQRQVRVPVETVMRCQVLEQVTEEISFKVPVVKAGESPVMVRRHSLFHTEKPMITTRQRAVVFPSFLSLPVCDPGNGPPPDPLGRPESPDSGPPPFPGTRGATRETMEPPSLPLPEKLPPN